MEYEKNPDGSDKLDEQGNPIPVEKVTDKELEAAKVEKLEKLEKDNTSMVEELKAMRNKLGTAEGLLKAQTDKKLEVEKPKDLTEDDKIALAVKKVLDDKDASNAQANKKAAFEKFVTDNKEFSSENDPTGLKRNALEEKFNRFNTEGLSTIDDFIAVIGEAKTLLTGNDKPLETPKDKNPYPNSAPKSSPEGKEEEELTPKELKLAETTGRTKEQILKLKNSDPDYLEGLLEFVK